MSNQLWILVAVVVIVAILVAYQRSRQSQVQQTRDLRMGAQSRAGANPRRRDQPARRATADRDVGGGPGVGTIQPAAEPGYPRRAYPAGPGVRNLP